VNGPVGILGGAFDPPHQGHLALALGGLAHFELRSLLVRVVALPGHKQVATPAAVRLALARLAFTGIPGVSVSIEPHGRTVDQLRALALDDPVFLIGADELAAFPSWKDPEGVLALTRLGVGTRPGVDDARVESILVRLARPDRVERFAIEAHELASVDLRARAARGEALDGLVPDEVAAAIEHFGLYRAA
jgi:nicotinate-nucleotide adenylyltransferase